MRYTIKIKKIKPYEDKPIDKSFIERVKGFPSLILKKSYNGYINFYQELLMNYFAKFFKKVNKEWEDDKDIHFFYWINGVDEIKAYLEMDEKKEGDLYTALYELRFLDFIKRKYKDPEKYKKEMENKFQKDFKIRGSNRNILIKIKEYFRKTWDENINLSIRDLCNKFYISVEMDKND